MSNIEILITLDKAEYERLQAKDWKNPIWANSLETAIHNGDVLPDGHGDLVDKNEVAQAVYDVELDDLYVDVVNQIEPVIKGV